MAEMTEVRRQEIRERLRRLEEMPPQSIVFSPPDWMALAEALDALETAEAHGMARDTEIAVVRLAQQEAEAELRLARELLDRSMAALDVIASAEPNGNRWQAMAIRGRDLASQTVTQIRREVEEVNGG